MQGFAGVRIRESRAFGYLSLFASFGTLICCALPSLLVLVGLGATVASFLTTVPWLVILSQHKDWVFAVSGALIAANFIYVYSIVPHLRGPQEACPPGPAGACRTAGLVSRRALWASATIYAVGFFAAFVLGPLLAFL